MNAFLERKPGVVNILVIIMLFLFSIDLLDLSGILITLTIIVFFVIKYSALKMDINAIILFLFSAFYYGSVVYFEGFSVDSMIKYAIAPWGCYILGYNLYLRDEGISVTRFAGILAFGFFLHGMLNLIMSIKMYGASSTNNFRLAQDFWQNRQISVTTAALYYSPLALMSTGAVFFAKRKKNRIFSMIVILLALYATILYQNRTLIMALGIVIAVDIVILFLGSTISEKRKIWIITGVLSMLAFAIVIWVSNFGGIRTYLQGTNLFSRLTGSSQDRTKIWKSFILGEAWKYPFGGTKAILYDNKPYVHNMWLDIFRRTGILPFAFMIIFTISIIGAIWKFCKISKSLYADENAGILISLMIGIALMFFVEPIIEANPYVFYFPIILSGTIVRCVHSAAEERNEVLDIIVINP